MTPKSSAPYLLAAAFGLAVELVVLAVVVALGARVTEAPPDVVVAAVGALPMGLVLVVASVLALRVLVARVLDPAEEVIEPEEEATETDEEEAAAPVLVEVTAPEDEDPPDETAEPPAAPLILMLW